MVSLLPPPTESSADPSHATLGWRTLAGIFAVAVAARVGWVWARAALANADGLEFPDEALYWSLAESIRNAGRLLDAEGARVSHMPLYPAFLSPFVSLPAPLQAARFIQAILAALAAPVVACLAARCASPLAGRIAGLAVALDPFFVFFSRLLLTESLFILALCAMWYAGLQLATPHARRFLIWTLLLAVCYVVGVYLRPSSAGIILAWAPAACVLHRKPLRPTLALLAASLLLVVTLWPWALRNERVTGRRTWLTLRLGISLYDGLGPHATGASDLAHIKTSSETAGMDEPQKNDYFAALALRTARENPARTLRLGARKFARTWSPFPHAAGYGTGLTRWISLGWMLGVYAAAALGLVALRRRPALLLMLLIPAIYFSLLHIIFVGSVRYRLPAMPMIEVIAAVGLAEIAKNTLRLPTRPCRC